MSGKFHHAISIVRPSTALQWRRDDPARVWFTEALAQWMASRASGGRLCFACDHEFVHGESPPHAFLFAEIDIQRSGPPRQIILSGICRECAARGDDELRRLAVTQLGFDGADVSVVGGDGGSVN